MVKIYLAHPGQPSVMRTTKKLQKKLEALGFTVHNPFDCDQKAIDLRKEWFDGMKQETAYKIVDYDLNNVNNTDILLAYVPTAPTQGTPIELYHAFTRGITVYVYSKIKSPWLIVPSGGKVYDDFDKLLEVLKKYVTT